MRVALVFVLNFSSFSYIYILLTSYRVLSSLIESTKGDLGPMSLVGGVSG